MAGPSAAAPAGTDQLDLEAAEQLIQLSGGDDGAGSESRSGDSVKCRGKEKEAAAVESRRRSAGRSAVAAGAVPGGEDRMRSAAASGGKKDDGDGGETGSKGAESFTCSTVAGGVEEKDKQAALVVESRRGSAADGCPARKDHDGGIVHGEARRRPKFRSLAAIYRDTDTRRPTLAAGGGGEGHADRDPSEGERKKKKRRVAGDVIPADAEASKVRRFGTTHAYVIS